jgi:hypothetical protein
MRAALLVMLLVGCTSSTEPEPCEPMPWCEAFKNDVVREPLVPWPDSIDPSTGLPYPAAPAIPSPRVTTP